MFCQAAAMILGYTEYQIIRQNARDVFYAPLIACELFCLAEPNQGDIFFP